MASSLQNITSFLRSLAGITLLLIPAILQGQYIGGNLPDIPDIIVVTVDHDTSGVYIEWEPSRDTAADLYLLYVQNEDASFDLRFEFTTERTHYYHINGAANLAYAVTAMDTLGSREDNVESLFADNVHMAVSLEAEFDACSEQNILNWTHYQGWNGLVTGYIVFGGRAGENLDSLAAVRYPGSYFEHEGIQLQENYVYYVTAIHASGKLASNSPLKTIQTVYPSPPDFIRIDEVNVLDPQTVEVEFSADIEGPVNDFRLVKRSSESDTWAQVADLPDLNMTNLKVPDNFYIDNTSFEYRIQAYFQPENCMDKKVLSESNPGRNIVLKGREENGMVRLEWTPYEEYMSGLSGYEIQRKIGPGNFIMIDSARNDELLWQEDISPLGDDSPPGEIQYQVLALSNNTAGHHPGISKSNVLVLDIESKVSIPNAITPNGDEENRIFKPLFYFAPEEYLMVIFDRSGRKLFETSNPGSGWNGQNGRGSFVMEGVYIYHIQYRDYTGKFRTRTGNVTVIY